MGRLTAIDYAVKDKSLYFAEVGGGSIGLLRLKDWRRLSWKKVVAVEGAVTSLALDWLSGNLYWIGGQPPSIHVAAPRGRWALALLSEGLQGAAWLALCPRASTMCFVTAAGSRGPGAVVECAAMDGTGRRAVWRRARAPIGLAFGGAGTRLYWADRGECGLSWGTAGDGGGAGTQSARHSLAWPRGAAPDPSVLPHLMSLLLCPAERGTISSIELDGSHFRVVREGLHGLSLFAIGEGFLLWSTTSTNGEPVCCPSSSSSYCTRTRGSLPAPVGCRLPLPRVKGRLGDPTSHHGHACGWRWRPTLSLTLHCLQAPARSGTAVWSGQRAGGSQWSRSW